MIKFMALGALISMLTACTNNLRAFMDYAELRRISSCVEVTGAMRGSSGIAGGNLAVKIISATGTGTLDQCFELMR